MQLGKEVTVKLPSTAREITVGQYQEYVKIKGEGTFKLLKALEIFANIPLKVADAMKADDVIDIASHVLSLITGEYPLVRTLKFRGREFGFIPNLEEISFGEYIDLDTYLTDTDQLHKVMNVLYRPITIKKGELYDIEEYKGGEGYKDFPLDVALGATLFFYRLSNKLLRDSQNSSQQEVETP